jgi:inorganic pyrophosphatase/exopolyphosphatase
MNNIFVPLINTSFICIVNRNRSDLAAIISSYLINDNNYLPLFEFRIALVAKTEVIVEENSNNYISQVKTLEFAIKIKNIIRTSHRNATIILAGLTENQKSYLDYKGGNLIEIEEIDDVDCQMQWKRPSLWFV